MYDSVTYPILRRMLGYTNDQQHYHYRHLMTLGSHVHLLISKHTHMYNNVLRCMAMLPNGLVQVD